MSGEIQHQNVIAAAWAKFERDAIPANATSAQRVVCRRCFMAGASWMFHLQAAAAAMSESDALVCMNAFETELQTFFGTVGSTLEGRV